MYCSVNCQKMDWQAKHKAICDDVQERLELVRQAESIHPLDRFNLPLDLLEPGCYEDLREQFDRDRVLNYYPFERLYDSFALDAILLDNVKRMMTEVWRIAKEEREVWRAIATAHGNGDVVGKARLDYIALAGQKKWRQMAELEERLAADMQGDAYTSPGVRDFIAFALRCRGLSHGYIASPVRNTADDSVDDFLEITQKATLELSTWIRDALDGQEFDEPTLERLFGSVIETPEQLPSGIDKDSEFGFVVQIGQKAMLFDESFAMAGIAEAKRLIVTQLFETNESKALLDAHVWVGPLNSERNGIIYEHPFSYQAQLDERLDVRQFGAMIGTIVPQSFFESNYRSYFGKLALQRPIKELAEDWDFGGFDWESLTSGEEDAFIANLQKELQLLKAENNCEFLHEVFNDESSEDSTLEDIMEFLMVRLTTSTVFPMHWSDRSPAYARTYSRIHDQPQEAYIAGRLKKFSESSRPGLGPLMVTSSDQINTSTVLFYSQTRNGRCMKASQGMMYSPFYQRGIENINPWSFQSDMNRRSTLISLVGGTSPIKANLATRGHFNDGIADVHATLSQKHGNAGNVIMDPFSSSLIHVLSRDYTEDNKPKVTAVLKDLLFDPTKKRHKPIDYEQLQIVQAIMGTETADVSEKVLPMAVPGGFAANLPNYLMYQWLMTNIARCIETGMISHHRVLNPAGIHVYPFPFKYDRDEETLSREIWLLSFCQSLVGTVSSRGMRRTISMIQTELLYGYVMLSDNNWKDSPKIWEKLGEPLKRLVHIFVHPEIHVQRALRIQEECEDWYRQHKSYRKAMETEKHLTAGLKILTESFTGLYSSVYQPWTQFNARTIQAHDLEVFPELSMNTIRIDLGQATVDREAKFKKKIQPGPIKLLPYLTTQYMRLLE